ncbi:MAG: DUF861 domain-containing protein [Solirubrobacteraceae bacterium]|nr:DUF861 domain-containing protein [Solirubrobacteraceae bacterium]
MEGSHAIDAATVALEPWPLPEEAIVAGRPEVRGRVLRESADGRVEHGVWEHTPGTSTDTEADEVFVVLSGRATVEVEGGPTLELAPGTVGFLRAGDRTTWTVHETLRKVYHLTR